MPLFTKTLLLSVMVAATTFPAEARFFSKKKENRTVVNLLIADNGFLEQFSTGSNRKIITRGKGIIQEQIINRDGVITNHIFGIPPLYQEKSVGDTFKPQPSITKSLIARAKNKWGEKTLPLDPSLDNVYSKRKYKDEFEDTLTSLSSFTSSISENESEEDFF